MSSAIVFCAGGAGAAGWNLCLADDGHATIELSHGEGECWNDVRRHHGSDADFDLRELAHHGCRDIPLVESDAGHGPPRGYHPGTPVVLAALAPAPPRPATAGCATVRCAPSAAPLRCLRSVVLII